MAQAARLQARQRFFNLVVTNVPGPQFPLYVLGRQLRAIYPLVPLAQNLALGIAIMSYDGALDFGLIADFDALPDLELLAARLGEALDELAVAAGLPPRRCARAAGAPPRARPAARRRAASAATRRSVGRRGIVRGASWVTPLLARRAPPPAPARPRLLTLASRSAASCSMLLFFEGRDARRSRAVGANVPGQARARPAARAGAGADPRDGVALSDDQLLHALELGDVVLLYGTRAPPPRAARAAGEVSGPVRPGARRQRRRP